MEEFNIAPNTQIGRIMIDHKVWEMENRYNVVETKYSRGGEFIENMVTDNHIEFMHRWFGLASIEELLNDIDEYYAHYGYGNYSEMYYNRHCPILPVINGEESFNQYKMELRKCIHFEDEHYRPENYTYEEVTKDVKKSYAFEEGSE